MARCMPEDRWVEGAAHLAFSGAMMMSGMIGGGGRAIVGIVKPSLSGWQSCMLQLGWTLVVSGSQAELRAKLGRG